MSGWLGICYDAAANFVGVCYPLRRQAYDFLGDGFDQWIVGIVEVQNYKCTLERHNHALNGCWVERRPRNKFSDWHRSRPYPRAFYPTPWGLKGDVYCITPSAPGRLKKWFHIVSIAAIEIKSLPIADDYLCCVVQMPGRTVCRNAAS